MKEQEKKKNYFKMSLGFLIGIAIFGLISNLPKDKKKEETSKQVDAGIFDQYLVHTKIRSNNDNKTKEQLEAYDLYAQQNFDQAMPLLRKLYDEQKDYLAYYYLGICYYFKGDIPKASEIFKHPRLQFYLQPI